MRKTRAGKSFVMRSFVSWFWLGAAQMERKEVSAKLNKKRPMPKAKPSKTLFERKVFRMLGQSFQRKATRMRMKIA